MKNLNAEVTFQWGEAWLSGESHVKGPFGGRPSGVSQMKGPFLLVPLIRDLSWRGRRCLLLPLVLNQWISESRSMWQNTCASLEIFLYKVCWLIDHVMSWCGCRWLCRLFCDTLCLLDILVFLFKTSEPICRQVPGHADPLTTVNFQWINRFSGC